MDSYIMTIILLLVISYLTQTQSSQYCEEVIAEFSELRACDGGHVRESLRQNTECRPRPSIMRLPWPNNTDVQQMTPSYVEVNLCDGACHSNRQGCVAIKTVMKKIPVMLAKCGIKTGKCSKECVEVDIEDHVECGCACEMGEDDCDNKTHYFVPDLCACQCRDLQIRRQCLDQGRIWSEQDCSCGCPAVHTCSSGSTYSNTTCSCSVEIETVTAVDHRVERSSNHQLVSWKLWIIIILLLLIFILLVVIFSLITKIHQCSRKLRDVKNQEPGQIVSSYMQEQKSDKNCPSDETLPYPAIYSYPSMEDDNIDRLPDPSCQG